MAWICSFFEWLGFVVFLNQRHIDIFAAWREKQKEIFLRICCFFYLNIHSAILVSFFLSLSVRTNENKELFLFFCLFVRTKYFTRLHLALEAQDIVPLGAPPTQPSPPPPNGPLR